MNSSVKLCLPWAAVICVVLSAQTVRAEEPAGPKAKPPTAEQIAAWIKSLDDTRYVAREEASQNLMEAGEAALDPLLAVANSDQPEPADRAIWLLRRLGKSRDSLLAVGALERLVKLQNWPAIVAKAEAELTDRSVSALEQRLTPLGAEVSLQLEPYQAATISMLVVKTNTNWHGTKDDLRRITQLRQIRNFRLQGQWIDDDVVRSFADKQNLAYLQLFDTKVTPDAVDAVKAKHPDSIVYVKNQALLGVSAENHAAGVLVMAVPPNTAAAKVGIVPGDVITALDGKPLPDFDRLTARIGQHQPNDKIEVEILRNNERIKVTPTLGDRSDAE